MENINFKGIPTSLFLNGPNVEIVSDSLTGNQIGSVTNNYPIFSVGTGVTFLGDGWGTVAPYFFASTYDTTNDKIVIAYQDNDDSNKGKAIVGTVTGTGITFGTGVQLNAGGTGEFSATYDSANDKVVIAYNDYSNSYYGTLSVGTVNGDTVSIGSTMVFETTNTAYIRSAYDSANEKVAIAYREGSALLYGTAVVFGATSQVTNLTTENYIGIAGEAISNAATGKVNVVGGVNSGQSGLTTNRKYYVGQTGILTTTADTPSVVAGTSISDTKILVWKS